MGYVMSQDHPQGGPASVIPELVYSQPLLVPRDFVPNSTVPWSATQQQVMLLDTARILIMVPTLQHGLLQSHVLASLWSAEYVFICQDAHRGPFQPPYSLFCVMETGDKTFIVDISGKPEYVSVDCLKHLDMDQSVELAKPLWQG
ncbi:hypothetical protein LDENG_00099610 [Lucifuga dentata]|nr:hypothetical protein LDENG_00099610 [Lucifuga dentata]